MLFMSRVFALGPASISDAKLARLIDRMTERGVYLCPTLQVFRVILAQGGPEDEPPAQQMMRERSLSALDRVSRRLTERMARGGVRMLVGQDGCRPAGALAEVRELQSIGLSRAEILRGLTVYPARFLDVADRYGAIAPGKVANLVVLPGNPLEDLAHLASPVLVVKSGEVVARAE
jgi:imidazolonepropionase-like amidohydrolase